MTSIRRSLRAQGARACRPRGASSAGFSLTELLIATALALIVMGAMAALFGVFGGTVSRSQATVELSGKMRSTAWQLRQDLAGVTVPLVPWTPPEANAGYFELIEGTQRDTTLALASGTATSNLEGDTDDILLFTTRSLGGPFVGLSGTLTSGTMTSLESNCAEVAWFCRQAAAQPVAGTTLYNLHRRQLLVVGYPGISQLMTDTTGTVPRYNTIPRTSLVGSNSTPLYDLSFRLVDFVTSSTFNPFPGSTLAQPNTLGDLTKREHRLLLTGSTAMRSGTFPYAFLTDATNRAFLNATFDQTDRTWEDVALTNVIAFDVRVFDPGAVAQAGTGPNLYPGDPGYSGGGATSLGGYVDLGWGTSDALLATGTFTRSPVDVGKVFPPSGMTAFQSDGMAVSGTGVTAKRLVSGTSIAAQRNALTYDTWSLHYEFNNVDDDLDGSVDEGTDGNDNNGDDVPDDPAEYETSPPYPVPLRGVEVRIRCYEPTSKQVRQITIRHTFVKK